MPEMDGIETLHRMMEMEDYPSKDAKVIMLTANAIMGAKEEYLSEGFCDYLSKPVRANELEEMVSKHLPPEMVMYKSEETTWVEPKKQEETEEEPENEEASTPQMPERMTSEEIFNLLDGKWESESKNFTIEFKKNSSGDNYHVTASGDDVYDSDISYVDETKTEDGEHKIRFVTAGTGHGSCRELLISVDGKEMSYISGIKKNEE